MSKEVFKVELAKKTANVCKEGDEDESAKKSAKKKVKKNRKEVCKERSELVRKEWMTRNRFRWVLSGVILFQFLREGKILKNIVESIKCLAKCVAKVENSFFELIVINYKNITRSSSITDGNFWTRSIESVIFCEQYFFIGK